MRAVAAWRDAWKRAQHCIIAAVAIYEPDWRTGKAVPTRITRADGELLGDCRPVRAKARRRWPGSLQLHNADAQRRHAPDIQGAASAGPKAAGRAAGQTHGGHSAAGAL